MQHAWIKTKNSTNWKINVVQIIVKMQMEKNVQSEKSDKIISMHYKQFM